MPLKPLRDRLRAAETFVLGNLDNHPRDIIAQVERRHGVPRASARRLIDQLCDQRYVRVRHARNGSTYELVRFGRYSEMFEISAGVAEDDIWYQVKPHLAWVPANVLAISTYGITEMVNNVLDHSDSRMLYVNVDYTARKLAFAIVDTGVGVFRKVQNALGLAAPEHAILELAKGKFTTNPDKHTGEGIFFTSRMFDSFAMISEEWVFLAGATGRDWLSQRKAGSYIQGTAILLEIDPQSDRTMESVLDKFSNEHAGFTKTTVPVRLADTGETSFISRSQAKRLLARVERFEEVILDFAGIPQIGPSFADQIFRVFRAEHPNTSVVWINANDGVQRMIRRAEAGAAAQD